MASSLDAEVRAGAGAGFSVGSMLEVCVFMSDPPVALAGLAGETVRAKNTLLARYRGVFK